MRWTGRQMERAPIRAPMRLALPALVLAAAAACTSTVRARSVPDHLVGQTVQVRTRDGETRWVRLYRTPSGLAWRPQQAAGGPRRLKPASDLVEVVEVDRDVGGLQGLGIGLLVGGVGGAIFGAVSETVDSSSCDGLGCIDFTPAEAAVIGGVFFGLAGAAVGGLFGLAHGRRVVHELEGVRPQGPPGSLAGLTWSF